MFYEIGYMNDNNNNGTCHVITYVMGLRNAYKLS